VTGLHLQPTRSGGASPGRCNSLRNPPRPRISHQTSPSLIFAAFRTSGATQTRRRFWDRSPARCLSCHVTAQAPRQRTGAIPPASCVQVGGAGAFGATARRRLPS
jgi:hypothetical protein